MDIPSNQSSKFQEIFGILLSRALLEIAGVKDDFPGTPKDMGPPYGTCGTHIIPISDMGFEHGSGIRE